MAECPAKFVLFRGHQASRPVADHEMELLDEGFDLLEIFASPFIRLEFQSATESDHVAKIANLSGLRIWIFDLLEHGIPNLGQLGFDSGGINLNGFAERFADEIKLLGERLHRGSF